MRKISGSDCGTEYVKSYELIVMRLLKMEDEKLINPDKTLN
ncbi:unnamed protein product [Rhodiola kirilowii]